MSTDSESIEDDRIVAKCYLELGNVTKEKGEYDESLRYHRKSMEIFERIDDPLSVADSHLNMAEIYKVRGDLKEAMSEYEKGLTLYEDVYVEDTNKNCDSGTDVSLNSSSFYDLQHTKALSKSDEVLPQTTLTDVIQNDTSTSSMDLNVTPLIKISESESVPELTASIDDSLLRISPRLTRESKKSLSSSSIPDIFDINANDALFLSSNADLAYRTKAGESGILEKGTSLLTTIESINHELFTTDSTLLDTKLENINNSNTDGASRLWHFLLNRRLLIIILSIFLTGILFWSLYDIPIHPLLPLSTSDSSVYEKSDADTDDDDDLSEQLRKFLTWRKDRMASLNKDTRRIIEDFIINSDSRTKLTVDKFQRILDILGLKIVLIPQ